MKDIQFENKMYLKKYIPEMYEKYSDTLKNYIYKDDITVNDKITSVKKMGRVWCFNSRYDVKYACDMWLKQLDDVYTSGVVLIFGLANGYYIKEVIKKLHKDINIIIYEPDIDIFMKAMDNVELSEVIERCNIVVEGINFEKLQLYIARYITFDIINETKMVSLPNYSVVYKEAMIKYKNIVTDFINGEMMNRNTEVKYGKEFYDNLLNNLWMIVSNSSVSDLQKAFIQHEKNKLPVVIVAAGPSLNKNIKVLKKFQNKIVIIACDAALNPLLKENIIPDIAVSVDSHKPLNNFKDERVKSIPFVLGSRCISWFCNEHKGKKFFYGDSMEMYKFFLDHNRDFGIVETGGSVANTAFSLAQELGFKTLILIGQDLAYEDGIYYAKGVEEKQEKQKLTGEDYFSVEGYYGGTVITAQNLNMYRKWFEKQIIDDDSLHVINATEGGALIHGAENKSLERVCNQLCNNDKNIKNIIQDVPFAFNKYELLEIKQEILQYDKKIDYVVSLIEKNISEYKDILDDINDNNIENIMTKYENISSRIQQINGEFVMVLATSINKQSEYDVIEDLNKDQGNEIYNIKAAVNKGINLHKLYLENLNDVKKELPILYNQIDI